MTAWPHRTLWLLAGLCAGSVYLTPLAARQPPPPPGGGLFSPGRTNAFPPPLPVPRSPIQTFRDLLALKPGDREQSLAQFPAEKRKRLMDKVVEYEAMKPEEREERLRTTELGWYLVLFMHSPATNRAAQLVFVPEADRRLVSDRIQQWDQLPPAQQKEVLEYESTMQYFVPQAGARTAAPAGANVPAAQPEELTKSVERWNSLPAAQREEMRARFEKFFRLTAEERQQTLQVLTLPERLQMAKSLRDFSQLPPAMREQCLKSFTKFASLSRDERDEFLKNAERWKEMSAAERQAWRNLVQRVPPMPPNPRLLPPMPQRPFQPALPAAGFQVTTNSDQ